MPHTPSVPLLASALLVFALLASGCAAGADGAAAKARVETTPEATSSATASATPTPAVTPKSTVTSPPRKAGHKNSGDNDADDDDFGESAGVMQNEALLHKVTSPLARLLERTDRAVDDPLRNFADLSLDSKHMRVNLFWVGADLPPRVQQIIDAAPAGVTVRVKAARYTYQDTTEAMDLITAQMLDDATIAGTQIAMVSRGIAGVSLTYVVDDDDPRTDEEVDAELLAALARITPIHVSARPGTFAIAAYAQLRPDLRE